MKEAVIATIVISVVAVVTLGTWLAIRWFAKNNTSTDTVEQQTSQDKAEQPTPPENTEQAEGSQ